MTETSVVLWMGALICLKQGPGATPPCVAVGGQDAVAIFALRERGRLPVIGKVNNRLTPWLPGRPGARPSLLSLISFHGRDVQI